MPWILQRGGRALRAAGTAGSEKFRLGSGGEISKNLQKLLDRFFVKFSSSSPTSAGRPAKRFLWLPEPFPI
jgi:hypothetical protein